MENLGSITLIVKAPNQKIEDRRVACDRSWTVRQLKEHLSSVYPEKPHREQQKLVYYGKLLMDESCLNEVLKHEGYEDTHTIHLVCPQHASTKLLGARPSLVQFQHSAAGNAAPAVTPTSTQGSELRHRIQAQNQQAMNEYLTSVSQQSAENLTAQQKLWLQAYQQQYTLYNYHLQQQALWWTQFQQQSPHTSSPDRFSTIPAAAHPPPQPAPLNQAADDDQVQLNAQGGVDAEVGQHDWLDHIYMVMRFGMLLMLLYFYTTIERFLFVFAAGVFFYLARGNFRLRRRQHPAPRPAPPQQQEQNHLENQNNENEERETNPATTAADENLAMPAQANTSAILGGVKLLVTVLTSFFSSLIPQNPAVAAN